MARNKNNPIIFISHIAEEKQIARILKSFIEKKFNANLKVFVSSHPEDIQLGDNWYKQIERSIRGCNIMIVICSPISIVKPWINFESGAGWIRRIPVIPLCHSGITPGQLPIPLNLQQGGVLKNQSDIQELFRRIERITSITPVTPLNPDSMEDREYFSTVAKFESDITSNILVKDTRFIYNLLFKDTTVLKNVIITSVKDANVFKDDTVHKDGLSFLTSQTYTFNDIYRLFNMFPFLSFINKKNYQVYYETVHNLGENIKFILLNNRLKIAPDLNELFNDFLYSAAMVDRWFNAISMLDVPEKEWIKKMIKERQIPPTKEPSHSINSFIDYYESLNLHKDWLVAYENIMKKLLPE